MKQITTCLVSVAIVALCATSARAVTPDVDGRKSNLREASGATTVCENGANNGTTCSSSAQCTGGGTCTGIGQVQIKARGLLTIIADTQPIGIGWADTTMPGCQDPSAGNPGTCETGEDTTFTLLLEFTLNSKKYTFAETFMRLPVGNCNLGCSGEIPNWDIGLGQEAGWSQPSFESTIAERSGLGTVTIIWGGLPPAAEAAVGAVIGRTGNQRVVLSRTDSVPICTDTTPCQLSGTNPNFSDHSSGPDPLATVRRYKVDIALVGP